MATSRENIKNDLFDTYLSVRFELVRHLKHRRLLILAALAIIVPLLFYIKTPDTAAVFAVNVLSFHNLLIVISAAMFAGDAVCGEFERKTSLLLFSTPQSRPAIFAGKYIAALMSTFLVVLLYYLTMTLQMGQLYGWGEIPTELGKSFLTALIYSASAVSVVFLFSAILKRSMPATILGFLSLIMILPIASAILTVTNHEPWFIVTYSAGLITDVIGASTSFGRGGGGGDAGRFTQYSPAFGRGIEVMVAYAVIAFVIAMVLANRKSED